MEIDTAELRGKAFRCIDGCGLCCLCQPELLPRETQYFLSAEQLRKSVTRSSIDSSKRAISMFPSGGPCTLLRDRKCTVYGKRPHFCRSFPVHTHLMWRVQLTADMTCRGVWRAWQGTVPDGYEDLESYGLRELHTCHTAKLESELREAAEVYRSFVDNCGESGVWTDHVSMRYSAGELIRQGYFSSISGMGRILDAAESSRDGGADFMSALKTVGAERGAAAASAVMEELLDEILSIDRIDEMPVFVDGKLGWHLFRRGTGKPDGVSKLRLGDRGGASEEEEFVLNLKDVAVSESGEVPIAEFASLTNSRDVFLGFVYYLTDDADYDSDVYTTYVENLAVTQLDLIIRSALANPASAGRLGRNEIADGIVFIDMDIHDAPTIGSVI